MTTFIVALAAITIGILTLISRAQASKVNTRLKYLEDCLNGTEGTEVNYEEWLEGVRPEPATNGLLARTRKLESLDLERLENAVEAAIAHDAQSKAGNLDRRFTAVSEALERRVRDIELRQARVEEEIRTKTANWAKLFGPLWKTQDGFTVVAPIMSDSHLRNAMKWIEEHPQTYGRPELNEHYLAFKHELARRDNDDTWHQRLQGCPSPRQVLAEAVQANGPKVVMVKVDAQGDAHVEDLNGNVLPVAMTAIETPIRTPGKKTKRTKKAKV